MPCLSCKLYLTELAYKEGLYELFCILTEGIRDAHMRKEHFLGGGVLTFIHDFQIFSDYQAHKSANLHSLWRMVSPRSDSTKSWENIIKLFNRSHFKQQSRYN